MDVNDSGEEVSSNKLGPFIRPDIAKTLKKKLQHPRLTRIILDSGRKPFSKATYERARSDKRRGGAILPSKFQLICEVINYHFRWELKYQDFCRNWADVSFLTVDPTRIAILTFWDKEEEEWVVPNIEETRKETHPDPLALYLKNLGLPSRQNQLSDQDYSRTLSITAEDTRSDNRRDSAKSSPSDLLALLTNESLPKLKNSAPTLSSESEYDVAKAINLVLLEDCRTKVTEWEEHWTGVSEFGKRYQLIHYVPARFSVELNAEEYFAKCKALKAERKSSDFDEEREVDRYELVEGETEEDEFDRLIELSKGRLCVSEGPGCGKSIFSRRILAYLCSPRGQKEHFNGKPGLVVRWEESSEKSGRWPEDFMAALELQLTGKPPQKNDEVSAELGQLLQHNRVFLILDALDQTTEKGKYGFDRFLERLSSAEGRANGWQCRIICTCRPYADFLIRGKDEISWRVARIERFNIRQQYAYLFGPVESLAPMGGAWLDRMRDAKMKQAFVRASIVEEAGFPRSGKPEEIDLEIRKVIRNLIPAREDDDPITSIPQSLFLIRQLIFEHSINNSNEEIRFESLADLYCQVCRSSLARAYFNTLNKKATASPRMLDWLEAMLSAMAMQMLVTDSGRFEFTEKDNLSNLMGYARRRVTMERPAFPALLREESDWDIVSAISQLTNRLAGVLLTPHSLAWADQRIKEYYAARHLLHNCEPRWVVDQGPGEVISCNDAALRKYATHPQWSNVWSLALDLAEAGQADKHPRKFLAAARHLFDEIPPQKRTEGGSQVEQCKNRGYSLNWIRPTQAMYRVLELLRREKFNSERDTILAAFQQQFTRILTDVANPQARIAAQVVPYKQLELMNEQGELTLRQLSHFETHQLGEKKQRVPLKESFVRCPKMGDGPQHFFMGSWKNDSCDEKCHEVTLYPFWMAATQVTREQYALFDPNHQEWSDRQIKPENNSHRCPVINVSWYSAFIYALFTGNKLPTEAQWEYACRAGSTGDFCLVMINGKNIEIAENSLGKVAYWDQEWKTGPQEVSGRSLCPNAWGLYDVHGNVLEWVCDWYAEDYYNTENAKETNTAGPSAGSTRVLRGGAFNYFSEGAMRCARRARHTPDYFMHNIGFRLCSV